MARTYLKGLPRLKAKLIKLKTDTMPAIRPVMETAAEQICDTMRSYVPVEHGDLRNAIGWTWGVAPRGSVTISTKIGTETITIFAGDEKAYYARFVEFGTKPHETGGMFKGGKHPGTQPQPFFYPAFRANRKQVKTMVRKAIRDAVKKAVA